MKIFLHRLLILFQTLRLENVAWLSANLDEIQTIKRSRTLAKAELKAELQIKNTQLAHDIALLKTRHAAELTILQTRCKADLNDYRQYLDALEQLKAITKTSFAQLPDAIVLTIHHHAKSLLNQMWESSDVDEKIKLEAQLLQFMATVHQESEQFRQDSNNGDLPMDTLKLIGMDCANTTFVN